LADISELQILSNEQKNRFAHLVEFGVLKYFHTGLLIDTQLPIE